MDFGAFLTSTPPEINIKIESWNDERRREAQRDYSFAVLIATGVNNPKEFPSFRQFYPEAAPAPKAKPQITSTDAKRDIALMVP